jgi:hypothetical protein
VAFAQQLSCGGKTDAARTAGNDDIHGEPFSRICAGAGIAGST